MGTASFPSITITEPYEKTEKLYREGMQKKYEALFGSNIIPFDRSEKNFSRILQRAYMKTPPFITSGTDKGFKDSLMWLSIIDFFSTKGETEVVFVSNDNGFKENFEVLCDELMMLKKNYDRDSRSKNRKTNQGIYRISVALI